MPVVVSDSPERCSKRSHRPCVIALGSDARNVPVGLRACQAVSGPRCQPRASPPGRSWRQCNARVPAANRCRAAGRSRPCCPGVGDAQVALHTAFTAIGARNARDDEPAPRTGNARRERAGRTPHRRLQELAQAPIEAPVAGTASVAGMAAVAFGAIACAPTLVGTPRARVFPDPRLHHRPAMADPEFMPQEDVTRGITPASEYRGSQ